MNDNTRIICTHNYCSFRVFSRAHVVRAQHHVKLEHRRRQASPAVVVVGKLGVRVHLFHTVYGAHDHVPVGTGHHLAQIEIHQEKTETDLNGRHEKKVCFVCLDYRTRIKNNFTIILTREVGLSYYSLQQQPLNCTHLVVCVFFFFFKGSCLLFFIRRIKNIIS